MVAKELDVIRLSDGRMGTVLEVYENSSAYLIEITDNGGKAIDTPIIAQRDIMEVVWNA